MFLSGLELFGFKSFPKRTKLTFQPGVMSIVGPNGCGKTNLVDAVRWVLGEQRTSILRSDKMENIIFSGANGRKPMHLAEITLTIENTHGILPSEYIEVTITRRLYRSGESEYLINKRPVRLKDIRNLFADTGLGPDSYSIIELSMVEGILSGRPDERRRLFEEAAGVTLYKSRLKSSRSKLAATEADLLRLDDLIGEVESQLRSLRRQVRRARRYRFLKEALRVKEISASRDEIADLRARLAPLEERIVRDRQSRIRMEKELSDHEDELVEVRGKLGQLEEQVSTLRNEHETCEARLQVSRQETIKLEERIRAGRLRSEERKRDKEELTTRRLEIAEKIKRLDREKIEAEKVTEEIRVRLAGFNETWREFEEKRVSVNETRNAFEVQRREAERELARLESESHQLTEQIKRLASRREQLLNEAKSEQEPPDLDLLEEKVNHLQSELEQCAKAFEEADRIRDQVRESRSGAERNVAGLSSELEAAKRRVDLLDGMVSSGQGRSKAVKSLLGSGLKGMLGRLGDSVSVSDEWKTATAAALEDAVSTVVMQEPGSFEAAARLLMKGDRGRGQLALSDGTESGVYPDHGDAQPSFAGADGVRGQLLDHVRLKGDAGRVAERYLRRVWVVKDINILLAHCDEALQGGWTLVTPDGCRLTPDGMLTAGTLDPTDLGAVHLLSEAREEQKRASEVLDKAQAELVRLQVEEKDAEERLRFADSERQKAVSAHDEARQEYTRAEAAVQTHARLKQNREVEKERLQQVSSTLNNRFEEVESSLVSSRQAVRERSDEIEEFQARLHSLEDEGAALSTAREKLRDEQVSASARLERLTGEVHSQGTLLEEISHRFDQLTREDEDSSGAEEDATERLRLVKSEAAVLEREGSEANRYLEKTSGLYETTRRTFTEKSGSIDVQRTELSRITDRLHAGELEVADHRHRFNTVRENIIAAYEIDLLTASQEELPLAVEEDNPYLDKPLSELREGLRDVGPVNQMAVEEFEIVDRRVKSLTEQREDLVSARDTLLETIDEINTVARSRFLETFSRVEGHFVRLFAKLFGGGEAQLSLGEGDPLEAGIKIYASPKGKHLTSIDLLSGGEKAMTAIALLFSLYLERPAPFCFLDEVDAPLDDENVVRFNGLLREFTDRTQFLVVTHNKLTMERADRLYGVTMAEEGVSRLVAVEIPSRPGLKRPAV